MTNRLMYCVETISWDDTKFTEEVIADSPLDAAIEILRGYGQPLGLKQIAVWEPGSVDASRRRLDGEPPVLAKTARKQYQCVICNMVDITSIATNNHTARCALA